MAALNSNHLKEVAKVCIAVCDDCAKRCKPHADKHWECKACMDSCNACIKACKKLLAA